jgi:acetyl-CoA carboxylase biotin carboxyl carrier protein
MIDQTFVESLIRALDESSLDSLELERDGTRLRLSKSPAAQPGPSASQFSPPALVPTAVDPAPTRPSPAPAAPEPSVASVQEQVSSENEGLLEVTSPMVGTFYSAPSPDADPYVEVGQRVGAGTVLCIIEAMKLMNELESEVGGTIVKIMVENAEPVEYGQVLFLIDPS